MFEIVEGDPALVARVNFVGNYAFSEARLRDIVSTQEQAWFRLLSSSDIYDPERLVYDRELLRRFYLRQGFADVQVTGSSGELTPDRSAFFVTFTINEGQRYRVGKVEINLVWSPPWASRRTPDLGWAAAAAAACGFSVTPIQQRRGQL